MTLRIGTRGSDLALVQSRFVAAAIRAATGRDVELEIVRTGGDRDRTTPLPAFGGAGAFTREIDARQRAGDFAISVHSLKDLPTEGRDGLELAAVPERAPVEDVLVAARGRSLDALPAGARVGTGSPRRRAQLLRLRADLVVEGVRGNVETRVARALDGDLDAVVLARAGLVRLDRADVVSHVFAATDMLPAAGQGALAVVVRAGDAAARAAVAVLDHLPTRAAVAAERGVLRALGGGCHLPVGTFGRLRGDDLVLTARVVSDDGRTTVEADGATPFRSGPEGWSALGAQVAAALVARGARELLP